MDSKKLKRYWKENIFLTIKCIIIWFIISFLFGIIFVDKLNLIEINSVKLGFFMAQQGSVYLFVFLVIFYIWQIEKLDKKYSKDN